ncbi:hypothetical protein D3C72_1695080 [compost metagenome]
MAAAVDCQGQGHVRGARAGRGHHHRPERLHRGRRAGPAVRGLRVHAHRHHQGAAAEARCRGHRGQYAGADGQPADAAGDPRRQPDPGPGRPQGAGRGHALAQRGDPHRHAQCAAAARRGPQGRPLPGDGFRQYGRPAGGGARGGGGDRRTLRLGVDEGGRAYPRQPHARRGRPGDPDLLDGERPVGP